MLSRNFSEVYNKGTYIMSDLYNRIESMCSLRKVSITAMCKESGASRASLSDLKVGRKQSLSADTLSKISSYFGVSVDYLLGKETEKAPTAAGERSVSDDDIKFALWGDCEDISDDDLDDVRRYAAFVRERKKGKK